MRYPVAERFKAPQGEGLYTGTQMAFVRLVGCSVGQQVCTACDTDFTRMHAPLGGGLYTPAELAVWALPCRHMCITGGEPLDRDLRPLLLEADEAGILCHVETSGTRHPEWLDPLARPHKSAVHAVGLPGEREGMLRWRWMPLWLTVSPKPGYAQQMIDTADEVKVILGGLGDGPGWPTVEDALRWRRELQTFVYVQPRNSRLAIDRTALAEALGVIAEHPELRLSVQLHKFLATR